MNADAARAEVAAAYTVLHAIGIFDYAGDVSLRSERGDTYFIRKARVAHGVLCEGDPTVTGPADIIEDRVGAGVDGEPPLPIEFAIHRAVYAALPEVRSVIHAHAQLLTALTIAGQTPEPVYIRGVETIGRGLPTYPQSNVIVNEPDVAAVLELLREHGACLLQAHGVVLLGGSLAEACVRVINLEHSAWMQHAAAVHGPLRTLPPNAVAARTEHITRTLLTTNVWNYYLARYGPTGPDAATPTTAQEPR